MQIQIPKVRNLQSNVQQIKDLLTKNPSTLYECCPFTIISGSLNTTNTGYKNVYSQPNDYVAFSKVFTGEEAIIAIWDHSYLLTQENPEIGDTIDLKAWYGTKHFQIGDVFKGILLLDHIGIDFTPSPSNSNFTQEQVVKSVSLMIANDGTNDFLFDNLPQYYFRLFQIPRLNIEIKPEVPDTYNGVKPKLNPYLNVDKQWYYLQGATKYWDKKTQKISYIVIQFASLNDKLATTGLAINQYVQTSEPGGQAALPTLNKETNTIAIDLDYLEPLPITHFQITYYGFIGLNSISFFGRPLYQEDISNPSEQIIRIPQHLFAYEGQAPIYDQLSLKGIPNNNYYLSFGIPTLDTYFTSWRDKLSDKQLFDETNTKTFEGHWRDVKKATVATNTALPTTSKIPENGGDIPPAYFNKNQYLSYWDEEFLKLASLTNYDIDIDTQGNQYFTYTDPPNLIDRKTITSMITFNYKDIQSNNFNMPNLLMFNSMVNDPVYQIPLSIHETIPITLNGLPVIGGFLNKCFGGINVGFKQVNSVTPYLPKYMLFLNCDIYQVMSTYLYAIEGASIKQGILPFNIFDNTIDKIGALSGASNNSTAFCFSLTDRIFTNSYDYDTKAIIQPQAEISTALLNQKEPYDDNRKAKIALINNQTFLATPTNGAIGFAIDALKIKSLGKVNYKIDFFSLQGANKSKAVDYDYCVYTGTYKTFSSATGNTRLWTELKQLSNPTFGFDEVFKFPDAVRPPEPDNLNHVTRTIDLNHPYNFPYEHADDMQAEFDCKYLDHYSAVTTYKTTSQSRETYNITIPQISGYTPTSYTFNITPQTTFNLNSHDVYYYDYNGNPPGLKDKPLRKDNYNIPNIASFQFGLQKKQIHFTDNHSSYLTHTVPQQSNREIGFFQYGVESFGIYNDAILTLKPPFQAFYNYTIAIDSNKTQLTFTGKEIDFKNQVFLVNANQPDQPASIKNDILFLHHYRGSIPPTNGTIATTSILNFESLEITYTKNTT